MPRGDRTGRNGAGPMTGRGLGYCAGNTVPGYMAGGRGFGRGRGMGMGFGRGMGYGRGYGFGYAPAINYGAPVGPFMEPFEPVSEIEALTAQAKNLEAQLSAITKRLEALNKGEEV
ncbi:MAG: DUF5320 domain-containing protein [Sphaerochaetaceae bacterium]|nr:DUF5320 domain-containing protein [Sphaerochaetaceae bacterium]